MQVTPFTHALTEDMERLDLNARQLGHRLGVSQQAIGKWLKQGFPPRRRVAELIEIFGEHSAVAALTPVQMYQEPSEKSGEMLFGDSPTRPARDPSEATAMRKLQSDWARDFTVALPPALRGCVDHKLTLQTPDGPRTMTLNYASERLLLEVVVRAQGGPRAIVSPEVTRLLTAARRAVGAKPRTVLALLSNMPDEDAKRGESVALAQALGIEVWVCRSGQELATRVCEAEGLDAETQHEDVE